jgi:hypothetical protein
MASPIVFFFVEDSKPREIRRRILESLCFVARGKFLKNQIVIGIATEKKIQREDSYDVLFLRIPEWTPEYQKQMEEIQSKTGLLTDPKTTAFHEEEYPPK